MRCKETEGDRERERERETRTLCEGGCVLYDDPRQKAEETGIRNHVVVYLSS